MNIIIYIYCTALSYIIFTQQPPPHPPPPPTIQTVKHTAELPIPIYVFFSTYLPTCYDPDMSHYITCK